MDHLTETLQENGYKVTKLGLDVFGRYRERRRLVRMDRTDGSKTGHVVLVYENDECIFDSSGVFKQVGDVLFAPMPTIAPTFGSTSFRFSVSMP